MRRTHVNHHLSEIYTCKLPIYTCVNRRFTYQIEMRLRLSTKQGLSNNERPINGLLSNSCRRRCPKVENSEVNQWNQVTSFCILDDSENPHPVQTAQRIKCVENFKTIELCADPLQQTRAVQNSMIPGKFSCLASPDFSQICHLQIIRIIACLNNVYCCPFVVNRQ